MRYQAIIFDLDGTTLDTDLYVCLNYLQLFSKFRPDYLPHLKELVYFSGPPLEAVFAEYFPDHSFEELYQDFKFFSDSNANRLSKLYPGEIDCLQKLKAAGYHLGIATSKRSTATKNNLDYFGLDQLIEAVVSVDQVARAKPAPDSLLKAAEILGFQPHQSIYIGDSLSDYQAAKAAGMDCGLVHFGLKALPQEIKPKYNFYSFKEIEEAFL